MAVSIRYHAIDRAGRPVSGVLNALSEQAAEDALWNSGLIVTRIRRVRQLPTLEKLFPSLFGPKQSSAISFARQLSTLLQAGFPMLQALEIMSGEHAQPALRRTMKEMAKSLSEGESFSDVLNEHPAIFSPVFVRLASIGEQTGDLAPMLRRAADYLESGAAVRSKIRSSLTYPAIVALTASGAIYVLLTFSIPMLAGLLEEFQADLPFLTRWIIIIGNVFSIWASRIFMLLVAAGVAVFLANKTVRGRYEIHRFFLTRPPFGGILSRSAMARVAQTLASLLQAGIPLHEALELTVGATENMYLRASLERVQKSLLDGNDFSGSLRAEKMFPPLFVEMSRVGERSGDMAAQLTIIQTVYQQEFEQTVARAVSLMEPLLILVVGGMVGLIGATVITTVYSVLPNASGI